jgi:archaellum biogenesis protein FlaJ (TadC family)
LASRSPADANAPALIHLYHPRTVTSRDARIQKWAIIAFAIVEAIVIAAVLLMRARRG